MFDGGMCVSDVEEILTCVIGGEGGGIMCVSDAEEILTCVKGVYE